MRPSFCAASFHPWRFCWRFWLLLLGTQVSHIGWLLPFFYPMLKLQFSWTKIALLPYDDWVKEFQSTGEFPSFLTRLQFSRTKFFFFFFKLENHTEWSTAVVLMKKKKRIFTKIKKDKLKRNARRRLDFYFYHMLLYREGMHIRRKWYIRVYTLNNTQRTCAYRVILHKFGF